MTKQKSIKNEVNRRKTFAIISHPDAGKTTLTEKPFIFIIFICSPQSTVTIQEAIYYGDAAWDFSLC